MALNDCEQFLQELDEFIPNAGRSLHHSILAFFVMRSSMARLLGRAVLKLAPVAHRQ